MEILMLITGIAIGGVLAGGTVFFLVYRRDTKTKLYQLDVFRDKRKAILQRTAWETGAVNCLVLKIHNGGSKLIEESPWYSSVVEEAPMFADVSAADTWQNIEVDEQYRDLIRKVRNKGKWYLSVDEMPQSFLKRTYERMGIKGSIVMKLYQDEYFFYYVSFPTRNLSETLTNSAEYNQFELTQISLMRLYEKYHRLDVLPMDWKFKL